MVVRSLPRPARHAARRNPSWIAASGVRFQSSVLRDRSAGDVWRRQGLLCYSTWRPSRSRGLAQASRPEDSSQQSTEKAASTGASSESSSRKALKPAGSAEKARLLREQREAEASRETHSASPEQSSEKTRLKDSASEQSMPYMDRLSRMYRRSTRSRISARSESSRSEQPRSESSAPYREQLERLSKMSRRVEISYIGAGVGAVVVLVSAGAVIMNWKEVRTHVSQQSAATVAETIRDKQLQYDASVFSKELLHQLLTDEEVAKTVSQWTYGIISSLKNEIGDLFVHILALEPVVQAVNRLGDRLVEYLCANQVIKERVGQLLVDAICLDSSRNNAANWAVDLVMREDVVGGFRDLVVRALQTEAVVGETRSLALQIVNTVLNDPGTQNEAKLLLNEILSDSHLRTAAKDSLWSIVMPSWGGSPKAADDSKKALKSLDEVMVMDTLTKEEREMLSKLQARVRSGSSGPAPEAAPAPVGAKVPLPTVAAVPDLQLPIERNTSPPAAMEASTAIQQALPPAGQTPADVQPPQTSHPLSSTEVPETLDCPAEQPLAKPGPPEPIKPVVAETQPDP